MSTPNKITILRRLSQQLAYTTLQMHEHIGRSIGLSGTDHKYLGLFVQKGKMTAGELALLTGLTSGAVTALIDRFENKKLIKRKADKKDRRKVNLIPDKEKIVALLTPVYKDFQDATDALIASLSETEQNVLESYFKGYIKLMEDSMRMEREEVGNISGDRFYHGTKADLQIGDYLTAGFKSNYHPEVVMNHVYFTALINGAGLAAELAPGDKPPRVYIVEPTGNFEDDPNVTDKKFPGNPTRSYRSKEPLKITGEVVDWIRLTPTELQEWRNKISALKNNSQAEIIN